MTDKEIINVLECCLSKECCADCDYFRDTCNGTDEAIKNALDLVKRQQAEIERLKKDFKSCIKEVAKSHEIDRNKAIEEFAERLKATFPDRQDSRCTLDDCYTLDVIDNLVKEMVGGNDA